MEGRGGSLCSCKGLRDNITQQKLMNGPVIPLPRLSLLVSVLTSSPGPPRRHRHAGGSCCMVLCRPLRQSILGTVPPAPNEKGIFNLRQRRRATGYRSSTERLNQDVYILTVSISAGDTLWGSPGQASGRFGQFVSTAERPLSRSQPRKPLYIHPGITQV